MSDPDDMNVFSQQVSAFMNRAPVRREIMRLINLQLTVDRCEEGDFHLLNDMIMGKVSALTDLYRATPNAPALVELDCDQNYNNNNNNNASSRTSSTSTLTANSRNYDSNSGSSTKSKKSSKSTISTKSTGSKNSTKKSKKTKSRS